MFQKYGILLGALLFYMKFRISICSVCHFYDQKTHEIKTAYCPYVCCIIPSSIENVNNHVANFFLLYIENQTGSIQNVNDPHSGSVYSNNVYTMRSTNNVGNENVIETIRIDTPSSLEPPSYNSVMEASRIPFQSKSQPFFTTFSQNIQNSNTI
ncbi:hypothetical protein BpHYR1_011444 [Brachionus plicatilis]|uniref:Uncharacterized protein n=1 Tax=Brachionus plicatilis TaxID=10195 RepID=A0A3M7QF00_BRAPC|nr:hypothetical protein BpHYR1_011444 [Brachionus plicatilis]